MGKIDDAAFVFEKLDIRDISSRTPAARSLLSRRMTQLVIVRRDWGKTGVASTKLFRCR